MDIENHVQRPTARKRLRLTIVALAVTLLGFMIATSLAGREAHLLPGAASRQHELTAAQAHLSRVILALTDAETGQRGYLLTADRRYLEPYDSAVQRLPALLHDLDEATAVAPGIKSQVFLLERDSRLKLAELAETLRLEGTGQHAEALALVMSHRGHVYMKQLRQEADRIDQQLAAEEHVVGSSVVLGVERTQALASLAGAALVTLMTLLTAQFVALLRSHRQYESALSIDIAHRKRVEGELRELTEVFDNTTDFIAQANRDGEVHYINKSGRTMLGMAATEPVVGRRFQEFYTADTTERFQREITPAVKANGVWIGETHVAASGGRIVPVDHMVIGHFNDRGELTRYSSVMRDISAEVAARHELARQTAIMNTIIEAIPAMVAVFDQDARCLLVNGAFERWSGLTRGQLLGRKAAEVVDPGEYEVSAQYASRALAGETISYEKQYPGATVRHVSLTYMPLRLPDGHVAGFFSFAQDITQHREENIRLLLLSERDPLTSLLNRAGFDHRLRSQPAPDETTSTAVLYIDLDRFKSVNDTYGHAVGDRVLKEFASRLQRLVRPTDAVARLGGDEFAVILRGLHGPEDVAPIARKVVTMAGRPFEVDGLVISIGASVGVALSLPGESDWTQLLEQADAMAYRAKANGRNQFVIAGSGPGVRSSSQ